MSPQKTYTQFPLEPVDGSDADSLAMAKTVLSELHGMLETLTETGQGNIVDLRSLPPLGTEGYNFLIETLGCGEVTAQIGGFGRSTVQETSYAGIWRVTHHNQDDDILTELIEVCFYPEILKCRQADIVVGKNKLSRFLKDLSHDHGRA